METTLEWVDVVSDVRGHQIWLDTKTGPLADRRGKPIRWCRKYLEGVRLVGADLTGAAIDFARVSNADLTGVDLSYAKLEYSQFIKANLRGANLYRASLQSANLTDADLTDANLTGADLRRCQVTLAQLKSADTSEIEADLWTILGQAVDEVPALLRALNEGRISGSKYTGPCCCLVGTLAKERGVNYRRMPGIHPNVWGPSERWFMAIYGGDTPETSAIVALTVRWVQQFMGVANDD